MESRIHSKINELRREKMVIVEQMKQCDSTETESIAILEDLVRSHSALEQRVRPKMKALLHSMHSIECRIVALDDKGDAMTVTEAFMRKHFERQYNFYVAYFAELDHALRWTAGVRSKYENTIRTVMEHRRRLTLKLEEKHKELDSAMSAIIEAEDGQQTAWWPAAPRGPKALTQTAHDDADAADAAADPNDDRKSGDLTASEEP